MAQLAYPVSDASNVGWINEVSSSSNLYQSIDEASHSSSDYVQTTWDGSNKEVVFGLTALSVPGSGSGTLSFYAFMSGSGPYVNDQNLVVTLKSGTTTIKSATTDIGPFGTTPNQTVINLSSGEVASVPDWADLSVTLETIEGDVGAITRVSQVVLSVPNGTGGGGGGGTFSMPYLEGDSRTYDHPNVYGNSADAEIILAFGNRWNYTDKEWRYKPTTIQGALEAKICKVCGMWVDGDRAVYHVDDRSGSGWYCPDHVYSESKNRSSMWRI